MTLNAFNRLSETKQLDIIAKYGVIVAKRKDKKYDYFLFQISDLYIELEYHKDHKCMPGIRGFTSACKSIIPYISKIDLSELISL